jgi:hypothetical protein
MYLVPIRPGLANWERGRQLKGSFCELSTMFWGTVFAVLVLPASTVAQSSNVNQCVFEYQWVCKHPFKEDACDSDLAIRRLTLSSRLLAWSLLSSIVFVLDVCALDF